MTDVLEFLATGIGPAGFILILSIGALITARGRWRRLIGVLLLIASMPISTYLAGIPLVASDRNAERVLEDIKGQKVDVVVALGAGVFDAGNGDLWPSSKSLNRTNAAMRVATSLDIPMIVTGGVVNPDLGSEAEILAARVELPVGTVIENKARSTEENALFSREIMLDRGMTKAIVVTSEIHTRRALLTFESAGVDVAAVVNGLGRPDWSAWSFFPTTRGLYSWGSIMYEYAGLGYYLATGKIAFSRLF